MIGELSDKVIDHYFPDSVEDCKINQCCPQIVLNKECWNAACEESTQAVCKSHSSQTVSYQSLLTSYILITRIYQWCNVSSTQVEKEEFRLFLVWNFNEWESLVRLGSNNRVE